MDAKSLINKKLAEKAKNAEHNLRRALSSQWTNSCHKQARAAEWNTLQKLSERKRKLLTFLFNFSGIRNSVKIWKYLNVNMK